MVVHAVVHRVVGAADADAGCDIVDSRVAPVLMYTATFVIVEVMVPVAVSGGMEVDDCLPYRCYEE